MDLDADLEIHGQRLRVAVHHQELLKPIDQIIEIVAKSHSDMSIAERAIHWPDLIAVLGATNKTTLIDSIRDIAQAWETVPAEHTRLVTKTLGANTIEKTTWVNLICDMAEVLHTVPEEHQAKVMSLSLGIAIHQHYPTKGTAPTTDKAKKAPIFDVILDTPTSDFGNKSDSGSESN